MPRHQEQLPLGPTHFEHLQRSEPQRVDDDVESFAAAVAPHVKPHRAGGLSPVADGLNRHARAQAGEAFVE
jgi:hypothetical protein